MSLCNFINIFIIYIGDIYDIWYFVIGLIILYLIYLKCTSKGKMYLVKGNTYIRKQ